jgi:hypothetical protein
MTVTKRSVIRTIAEFPDIDGGIVDISTHDWADAGIDGEQLFAVELIIGNYAFDTSHIPALIDALCAAKKVLDAVQEAA